MEAMATETTDRKAELARTYLALLVPSIRDAMGMTGKDVKALAGLLDWAMVMEPIVPIFVAALSEDELSQAIAWVESPLFAKLGSLQSEMGVKVQAGLMQAMGKLLAEDRS